MRVQAGEAAGQRGGIPAESVECSGEGRSRSSQAVNAEQQQISMDRYQTSGGCCRWGGQHRCEQRMDRHLWQRLQQRRYRAMQMQCLSAAEKTKTEAEATPHETAKGESPYR